MNYEEARNYIAHIQGNLGSDYSLKEVTRLAEYMDRPDKNCRLCILQEPMEKGLQEIIWLVFWRHRDIVWDVTCHRQRIIWSVFRNGSHIQSKQLRSQHRKQQSC